MGNAGTSHGTNSRPASEVIHLSSGQYVALRAGHVGGIQSFLAKRATSSLGHWKSLPDI